MPPSGDPAAALPMSASPARLLQTGEIIIFALRPSVWFIVLVSLPVIVLSALVPLILYVAIEVFGVKAAFGSSTLVWVFLAAALARLTVACFQWTGRLYVLTNLRVMTVWGSTGFYLQHCPLKDIREVLVSSFRGEGRLGLGTLSFRTASGTFSDTFWPHVSNPAEVASSVNRAIGKIR